MATTRGRIFAGETLVSEAVTLPATDYTRPADWLALPDVTGLQKFAGVHAVWGDESDYVALQCAGAYTVDWGDGSATEDIATNTSAYHLFDYDGLADTDCSRGYRQAIVTVVPQAGQNLTKVDLSIKHTATGTERSSGWLDIAVAGANLATLALYSTNQKNKHLEKAAVIGTTSLTSMNSLFRSCFALRSVQLDNTEAVTNFGHMFHDCYSLQTIPSFDTSACTGSTSSYYMFTNCYNLRRVPNLDMPLAANFTSFFDGCASLEYVPDFDTSAATNMNLAFHLCTSLVSAPMMHLDHVTNLSNMFQGCSALKYVPAYVTSTATTHDYMFDGCAALATVPLLDLQKSQNVSYMFRNCTSLVEVPALQIATTRGGTACPAYSMFSGCSSLREVGAIETSNVTDLSYLFYNCYSLETAPSLDSGSVTGGNFVDIFTNCYCLRSVPVFETAAATSLAYVFSNCSSLEVIGAFDLSGCTTYTSTFNGCASLQSVLATGIKSTVSFANANLGAAALNTLYGNLATVTSKTITVTGNPGTAGDDPTIASNKGWTVTGS